MYDRFDAWVRSHPAVYGLLGALTILVAMTILGFVTNAPIDSSEMWLTAGAFLAVGVVAELVGRWRNGTSDAQ